MENKTGIEVLLRKEIEEYVKMPMLEVILERFIKAMSSSLRNYTSDVVDIKLLSINNIGFAQNINTDVSQAIAIFRSEPLRGGGIITFESKLIYDFIDTLLGGRKAQSSVVSKDNRQFTAIELNLFRDLASLILSDLNVSFEYLTPLNLTLDRTETNPKFAMIVRPEEISICITMEMSFEGRSGKMSIIIPYSSIEPIKSLMAQPYISAQGHKDPNWMHHMERQLLYSTLAIEVRDEGNASLYLSELAALKVGSVVPIHKESNATWGIYVADKKIAEGTLGKVDDHIAIIVADQFN